MYYTGKSEGWNNSALTGAIKLKKSEENVSPAQPEHAATILRRPLIRQKKWQHQCGWTTGGGARALGYQFHWTQNSSNVSASGQQGFWSITVTQLTLGCVLSISQTIFSLNFVLKWASERQQEDVYFKRKSTKKRNAVRIPTLSPSPMTSLCLLNN